MSIGLKRGTVKLVSHDKKWKRDFKKEKQKLLKALDFLVTDIRHIGSTSVNRVKAKPIIDIVVGVKNIPNVKVLSKLLKPLGYNFRINGSTPHRHLFFAKGIEAKRTHYLHVEKFGSQRWQNYLRFLGELNRSNLLAKEYENLKTALALTYPDDRESYTKLKNRFIKNVIKSQS